MIKLEDFKIDKWDRYLAECINALNSLDKVIHDYYHSSSAMTINEIGDLREEIDLKAYFVAEAMQPLYMCIPGWEVIVYKAKKSAIEDAKKDTGSITTAKEVYKSYEPFSSENKTFNTIESCLKMCKISIDKAGGISNSLAYKTRGNVYTGNKIKDNDS